MPSPSVDVETSVPGDFFTHMRASLAEQRGETFRRTHRGETQVPDLIGVRDVMRMATRAGARANGLEAKVVASVSESRQTSFYYGRIA